MKTFHITKHNFLDFYFEENHTEESTELRLDLANKVIDLLIKIGNAVITTEQIFNDCNHESIKLSYLEEFENDKEAEGELRDIKFEYKVILIDSEEPEKFARKCSITGEGMNEGWFINGKFFKYKEDADKEAQNIPNEESSEKINYKNFDELYNSFNTEESNDFAYYTEWTDEGDYQYEMINGVLTEIEK